MAERETPPGEASPAMAGLAAVAGTCLSGWDAESMNHATSEGLAGDSNAEAYYAPQRATKKCPGKARGTLHCVSSIHRLSQLPQYVPYSDRILMLGPVQPREELKSMPVEADREWPIPFGRIISICIGDAQIPVRCRNIRVE